MYQTLLMDKSEGITTVTFNRLDNKNSINIEFMDELMLTLDEIEQDVNCKVLILTGQNGIFCTGMDFDEFANGQDDNCKMDYKAFTSSYMALLKRISLLPVIVISKVDGIVMAGGIGIMAASDLVIATPRSQFSLSEVIWGLLPSMVLPYLIRRVSFQTAYKMTLTTLPVNAEEAKGVNLVDEVSDNLHISIRKLTVRLLRLQRETVKDMKAYFRKLWIIDDEMEAKAVEQTSYLSSKPTVKRNIYNYVNYKKFPWEN